MNRSLRAGVSLLATTLAPALLPAADVQVTADITADTVWTADNTYILNDIIYVANGASLTIQAGTVIRGLPDQQTAGANNPGALIIARGAKIFAIGSPEAPIVFTDFADDNFVGAETVSPDYATWNPANGARYGSLAILGNASINGGTSQVGNTGTVARNFGTNAQLEGLPAKTINDSSAGVYGGLDDDDSSGILKYISLRYGGYGLSANSEINALSLGGVGRGTIFEYIDIMNNIDDGVEFFGGTASLKYVSIWGAGDDSIDYDQGYRGKMQFVFIVQAVTTGTQVGSGFSDKMMEMDGGIGADSTQPYSIPTVYNVTGIGLGSNKAYVMPGSITTGPEGNLGPTFRDNAGGRFYNSLFLDIGGQGLIVEDTSSTVTDSATRSMTDYTSYPDPQNASVVADGQVFNYPAGKGATYWYRDENSAPGAKQLEMNHNLWGVIGGLDGNVATTLTIADAMGETNAEVVPGYPEGGHSGGSVARAVVAAGTANGLLTGYTMQDILRGFERGTADPTLPDPVVYIDPRPNLDTDADLATMLTTGLTAPADGFFTPVSYKGAFSPSTNWLAGWSTPALLGLFGDEGRASGVTSAVAAISQPLARIDIANSELGKLYGVYSSATVGGTYTLLGSVGGNGSTVSFVDLRELTEQQFYKVEEL